MYTSTDVKSGIWNNKWYWRCSSGDTCLAVTKTKESEAQDQLDTELTPFLCKIKCAQRVIPMDARNEANHAKLVFIESKATFHWTFHDLKLVF
eukprot:c27148_g1_i3 orf=231-509(+)